LRKALSIAPAVSAAVNQLHDLACDFVNTRFVFAPVACAASFIGHSMEAATHIHIKGAREHNLKNLEVRIPRGKFVVITGPSGSG
jgi:ABC-type multidrug transport system fused ATPase/permease subunit